MVLIVLPIGSCTRFQMLLLISLCLPLHHTADAAFSSPSLLVVVYRYQYYYIITVAMIIISSENGS